MTVQRECNHKPYDLLRGKPGDWLLRHQDGNYGVVADAIFRETYEPDPGDAD